MKSSSFGKLIVIDGGEGSGKGELLRRTKTRFPDIVLTREPGGTPYAEATRNIVLSPLGKDTSPRTQLLAVMSARSDHMEKVIRPNLESGKSVVTDRFDSASFAYQVAHDPSLRTVFYDLRSSILEGDSHIAPIYIFLDVEPEIGLARRSSDSARESNHFDDRPVDYHSIVRSGYHTFMDSLPSGQKYIINAKQPLETVMSEALEVIASILAV